MSDAQIFTPGDEDPLASPAIEVIPLEALRSLDDSPLAPTAIGAATDSPRDRAASSTFNGRGTSALWFGIASVVLGVPASIYGFAWVAAPTTFVLALAVVAIVQGIRGRRAASKGLATNPGVALAGLLLGIATALAWLAIIAYILLVLILFATAELP